MVLEQMRTHAEAIFRKALKAVDPYEAVKMFVRLEGDILHLGRESRELRQIDLSGIDRVLVVGGGKATAPMARAIEDIIGPRLREGNCASTAAIKYATSRGAIAGSASSG